MHLLHYCASHLAHLRFRIPLYLMMICEKPKGPHLIFVFFRKAHLASIPCALRRRELNSQALFFVLLFLIGVCEWLVCCGEGAREVPATGHNIESIGVRGLRMVQVQRRPTRPQRAIASSKKEHAERWRGADGQLSSFLFAQTAPK